MKKMMCIFVALAMLFALAPMNIIADDAVSVGFTDVAETDYYAQAAKELQQLNILEGYPDGTFGASKSITRAEMAAVVCRIINMEAVAENSKGATAFDDVADSHWATGYINVASFEGIINGDGNGKFRPEDDIKYEEAIKMIVCALGYGEDVAVDPADWSKAYLEIADAKGISANLKGKKGEAATRGDIAVMSFNGISISGEASGNAPAAPVMSKESGEYKGIQKVELTTTTKGADIYYTTDGTTPTAKSVKYTKAITVSKSMTLKAIAIKDGVASKVTTASYTIKTVGGGGGGGGGDDTPSATQITSATLKVGANAVTTANAGDVLSLVTDPETASGTITWTVGGVTATNTGRTYTVTTFDMGKTIVAKIVGSGSYQGTASASVTVASSTQVTGQDIMGSDVDSSPIVLTDMENTTFLDGDGNPVVVDASSSLTLSIENPNKTPEEIAAEETIIIQEIVNNTSASASDLDDIQTVAVDVNLSLNESEVHPVGSVTVTLSAGQLGLATGTDLTQYAFSASHTNKEGTSEVVDGVVVEIDGVQYVRFELNGLSTVWIGNIPPRTVSFYNLEEDADNQVNSIGSVVVKFGDLTPTAKIPTASRAGYLFCGWNYDVTRTPIISNLDIHALWIEGEKMPAANFDANLSQNTSALTLDTEDGLVSINCEEPESVPANVDLTIDIDAPANAVKYYVGTDASVVAAFNDAEGFTMVDAAPISISVDVSDESGVVIPSSNSYYYKWIDSEGTIISIQQIEARVANGSDSATSMTYTASVDRGIGTFEVYLVDNQDADKDYVGYINNNLEGKATEGYTLSNNVSFDSYRCGNDFSAYDSIRIEFTPFEGHSFDSLGAVTAGGEYYANDVWNENWTGSYQVSGGKLIVTYPFSALASVTDYATAIITANGVEQEIYINWYGGRSGGRDYESITCNTWEEILTALQGVTSSKEYSIHYRGSSPVTITSSVTIPENVNIDMGEATQVTISNGATVTLMENKDYQSAAYFNAYNADLYVADGGKLEAKYTGTDYGTTHLAGVSAKNIVFASGSVVDVLYQAGISMNGRNDEGSITFESGSTINSSGHFHVNNFDTININGTVNSDGYTYFYSDEINIGGTINSIADDYYGRVELHGSVTIGTTGVIDANSTGNRHFPNVEIYGPLTNKGRIELRGSSAMAEIMNNGYVVYNEGTISVASGCSIVTSGTKYINTGVISGAGKIQASLGDDYTNYDDGTEYVYVDNDEYWDEETGEWVYMLSDYSRYKFTHDPAEIAEVTLYLAEIVNMGAGTCTLTIEAEALPQN